MAASSGQPQDTKVKKQITPEQQKTYGIIGGVVLLLLVGGAILVPRMMGGGSTTDTTVSANTVVQTPGTSTDGTSTVSTSSDGTGGTTPGMGAPGTEGAPGAVTLTSVGTTKSLRPPAQWSPDPFVEKYLYPTPAPTPIPPVEIPGPVDSAPVLLPGTNINRSELQKPLILPEVTIPRLNGEVKAPVNAFPPRRSSASGGGAETVTPSYDKRLSGVIIGDGVRALLEITSANGIVTRVVQPGDEVDGITILNIQRYNDGTRTVTKMLIRENGEERSVELRAGVQQQAQTGTEGGGEGGFPGGAFPGGGMPGGFQQRR